jgi:glycosyltransferase involved in cell wall biosynthesis
MDKDIWHSRMKKVLIIAYSFPPVGGGRVRRVLKFVKFLPEFGWQPFVLTVKRPQVPEYDEQLLREISTDIKVVRTNSLEPTNRMRSLLNITAANKRLSKILQILIKICTKIKYFIFLPDTRTGWIPFCVFHGWRIVRSEKIDIIFASAEPFSSFIAAVVLKRITKKPLILDFRDEWVGFSRFYFPGKPTVVRKLEALLEKIVVNNADKVISVTESIIKDFISRYPSKKNKFLCITNGFDPDDFKNISKKSEDSKFTITYAGTLYKLRTPAYFLKAVKLVLRQEPDFSKRGRIRFVGTMDGNILELFNDNELKDIIDIEGFLPHQNTLVTMAKSNLLLFIEDQLPISNRLLPAKLFEYMATQRPILALANDGSVKKIISYTRCGQVIPPTDIEGIAVYLSDFYRNFKAGREIWQQSDCKKIMEFSRKNTTQKLSEIFNSSLTKNA